MFRVDEKKRNLFLHLNSMNYTVETLKSFNNKELFLTWTWRHLSDFENRTRPLPVRRYKSHTSLGPKNQIVAEGHVAIIRHKQSKRLTNCKDIWLFSYQSVYYFDYMFTVSKGIETWWRRWVFNFVTFIIIEISSFFRKFEILDLFILPRCFTRLAVFLRRSVTW